MKGNFSGCKSLTGDGDCKILNHGSINAYFRGMLKGFFTLLVLFVFFKAGAQVPMPTAVMRGPVTGTVNGAYIFITTEVRAGDSPVIIFSLINNYSGASIVSQGTFTYDNTTGIGVQIVEINPGNTKGSFVVKATTTNAKDTAISSMTVSVGN